MAGERKHNIGTPNIEGAVQTPRYIDALTGELVVVEQKRLQLVEPP